jgi:hypothetical protein
MLRGNAVVSDGSVGEVDPYNYRVFMCKGVLIVMTINSLIAMRINKYD